MYRLATSGLFLNCQTNASLSETIGNVTIVHELIVTGSF